MGQVGRRRVLLCRVRAVAFGPSVLQCNTEAFWSRAKRASSLTAFELRSKQPADSDDDMEREVYILEGGGSHEASAINSGGASPSAAGPPSGPPVAARPARSGASEL
eukprot:6952151-Pyramimonas_sp.AAC.1